MDSVKSTITFKNFLDHKACPAATRFIYNISIQRSKNLLIVKIIFSFFTRVILHAVACHFIGDCDKNGCRHDVRNWKGLINISSIIFDPFLRFEYLGFSCKRIGNIYCLIGNDQVNF